MPRDHYDYDSPSQGGSCNDTIWDDSGSSLPYSPSRSLNPFLKLYNAMKRGTGSKLDYDEITILFNAEGFKELIRKNM